MRFAGDVDFEVRNNDDIDKAVDTFRRYIIEALPTKDATAFTLKLMFDAEGSSVKGYTYNEGSFTNG